jgi:Mrp family chromosome partitioning ATPase
LDRLEKALEKARQERQEALDAVAPGLAAVSAPPPSPAHSPAPVTRTRNVEVPEAVLESHRIVARHSRDPNADVFRILRTKVQQMLSRNNLKSVGITSPNYRDGKTTIAVNLALGLALDVKQTVCLVDLNLRTPMVHRYLGIGSEVGLGDFLLHDTPLSECLVRPPFERLVVLPTSRALEASSETLATPKMAALAEELQTRYADRIVIYDLPAVLPQDDVIAFLPNLDSVIVVVREGVTPVDDIRRCLHSLGDTTLLGTVLNQSRARGYNTHPVTEA